MAKHFTILIFSLLCTSLFAQKEIVIKFNSLVNDTLTDFTEFDFDITSCKFYISQVHFLKDQKVSYVEKNSFHLIDFMDEKSLSFKISPKRKIYFDEVVFVLGIDSITNHKGVQSGVLDPMQGMYWAWQSGYINFKIEGESELCETENKKFAMHLGGFLFGNRCDEKVQLAVETTDKIEIDLDLEAFLYAVDLKKVNHVMSPGTEAVRISQQLANFFKIRYYEN